MIEALSTVVTRFVLTDAPTAPASRAWRLSDVLAYTAEKGYQAIAEPSLDRALRIAEQDAGTVLVTGSFHTVGDAMARLQVSPLTG